MTKVTAYNQTIKSLNFFLPYISCAVRVGPGQSDNKKF